MGAVNEAGSKPQTVGAFETTPHRTLRTSAWPSPYHGCGAAKGVVRLYALIYVAFATLLIALPVSLGPVNHEYLGGKAIPVMPISTVILAVVCSVHWLTN